MKWYGPGDSPSIESGVARAPLRLRRMTTLSTQKIGAYVALCNAALALALGFEARKHTCIIIYTWYIH